MSARARAQSADQVRALTGDSFFDGVSEVRLDDVLAPAPLEPYGKDATLALNRMILSGPVTISDIAPADRWGRRVARVSLGPETRSLEEALVAAGSVRVRPQSDDDAFIVNLLTLEREAREAKRGLWGDWRYRLFDAMNADAATGSFNIVEGVVRQAVARSGRVYSFI